LSLLEILANQIAIAIDNSLLVKFLQDSNKELKTAYNVTIEGLSRALELRDRETEGHTRRVTDMTVRFAASLGIRDPDLGHLSRGAMLHDIGKMGVSDLILKKPGDLTPEERLEMQKHPQFAFEMLNPIAYLQPAIDIPYCHHEKWDGSGYPRGLAGDQIPLSARIFSIVDVWDAVSHDRYYHKALPPDKVAELLLNERDKAFNAQLVQAFVWNYIDPKRS
jgi:HD-GYP domain-containing protein (c-di-GMP phosphodiesterase class II)